MFISGPTLLLFMFILARVIGCFMFMPFFGERSIPQMFKLIFALWITLSLFLFLPQTVIIPENFLEIVIAGFNEFLLGLFIGFIVKIIFEGLQFAGSLMDMQMGLSSAAAFDPSTGTQSTVVQRLVYITAMTVFLIVNGHHLLLTFFFESYKVIPLFSQTVNLGGLEHIGILGSKMFSLGISLAMPVIIIIFMLDFSLGLLARLAPQVNVFFLGFQMKPMMGAFLFLLLIPTIVSKTVGILETISEEIMKYFQYIEII
jgi:flagellar biosynthetic protein FliR